MTQPNHKYHNDISNLSEHIGMLLMTTLISIKHVMYIDVHCIPVDYSIVIKSFSFMNFPSKFSCRVQNIAAVCSFTLLEIVEKDVALDTVER